MTSGLIPCSGQNMRSEIYRIIDVNINRATEGVRVVEEICRFVLEDSKLTLALKELRSSLSRVIRLSAYQMEAHQKIRISEKLIGERKAVEDIGRKFYPESEGRRGNIESIFQANMKRAQEAVRCLEEFSKLIKPHFGKAFKNIRFKLYELEKQIAPRVSKAVKLDFDLYVVTDPRRNHLETARRAVAGGAKIIQLRDKTISKLAYCRLAKKIAKIAQKKNVTFILNDYWDLVRRVGADGVHLGQEDLAKFSIRRVRKELGADKILGISTHSFNQAVKAEKLGADYISVGPIFSTPSKPGTKPVGLRLLRKVIKHLTIPVVAIGGIDKSKLPGIKKTGADRFAVIRAVLEAKDISQAVRSLRKAFC